MKKIVFILFLMCSVVTATFAQNLPASLNVKGESKLFQLPDIMNISITVSNKASEYADCIEKNSDAVNRLKKALKMATIQSLEIQDVGQRVNEEKTYSGGKSVPDGYRATYNLKLQLSAKPKIIHECLKILKTADVEINYQVSYGLSPELIKSVESKLIKAAVADAKSKAIMITEASESKLGQIVNINYGTSDFVSGPKQYMTEMRVAKAGRGGDQSFTNPDAIELNDSVEISFRIQP
ncbi:DUF541 domain-containing protein [Marinifilum sp. N1E240]|uniref:SIMPL domain-containing protein n=1 Tax=Marinifilum sp. N1E240 TaxID=2608082 RepID=UPI00128E7050|nr:SIMPL domain-containing protein [Marinifilum sp. N1E240]MPQ46514.1 DUF541 domain-containing protein [Marinifilum sp. N1E240]